MLDAVDRGRQDDATVADRETRKAEKRTTTPRGSGDKRRESEHESNDDPAAERLLCATQSSTSTIVPEFDAYSEATKSGNTDIFLPKAIEYGLLKLGQVLGLPLTI